MSFVAFVAVAALSSHVKLPSGIELTVYTNPLRITVIGTEQQLTGARVSVAPAMKAGHLQTSFVEGRWKCVIEKEKPIIDQNLSLATLERDVVRDGVRSSAKERVEYALSFEDLPSVETKTTAIDVAFVAGASSSKTRVELKEPRTLHPLLEEILNQYGRLGGAVILPSMPPQVHFVENDLCGDTAITTVKFSGDPQDFKRPTSSMGRLLKLGETSSVAVYSQHGWVFTAKRGEPFRFEQVDVKNSTFLGKPYELALRAVETGPDRLTANFTIGDFAGCFGAGCGDPVNLRTAAVTVDGVKMSTRIKKSVTDGEP